jgi:hypothetical protein
MEKLLFDKDNVIVDLRKLLSDKDKLITDIADLKAAVVEFQNREAQMNAEQMKEVTDEYEKLLSDKDKLIADLKAAVVQFQNRETLRSQESTAAQNLLKQQSSLIKSFQQLSGRQVVKQVKPYNFYYLVRQVCHGSSAAKLRIPRIVITPPSPKRTVLSEDNNFASILAAIPVDGVYKSTRVTSTPTIESNSFTANSTNHFHAGQWKVNQPWASGISFPAPRLADFFNLGFKPQVKHVQEKRVHEKHIHHHHYYMDDAEFGHNKDEYYEDPYFESELYCKNNYLSEAADWEKARDIFEAEALLAEAAEEDDGSADNLAGTEEWEKARHLQS